MSKLKKYLKSIAGGKKGYKKLAKSIVKDWEKYALLSDADLSSVAGGENLPKKALVPLEAWREQVRAEGYRPSNFYQDRDSGRGYQCCSWRDADGVMRSRKFDIFEVNGEWYVKTT